MYLSIDKFTNRVGRVAAVKIVLSSLNLSRTEIPPLP